MFKTKMDTPEKQLAFIKWYSTKIKQQLINFGKMQQTQKTAKK